MSKDNKTKKRREMGRRALNDTRSMICRKEYIRLHYIHDTQFRSFHQLDLPLFTPLLVSIKPQILSILIPPMLSIT